MMQSVDDLLLENESLRRRLEEAEETLRALRTGEVDAIFVEAERQPVYTLESADKPYRLLVAQMPIAAATLTADGKIIACNRRFADLLKRSPESLRCQPFLDVVAPGSRSDAEALILHGRTIEASDELTLVCDDGTTTRIHLGINSLREGALGQCLIVTDLTERKHYEELLRTQSVLQKSEWQYREMFNALPVAIYTTDAQGRLTYYNAAAVEFSGRVPELGTDKWCVSWKLYHADGTPMALEDCPMAVAIREGRPVRGVQVIAERPDGVRITCLPYPTPLRDHEGRVVAGINMLVDLTERLESEKTTALLSAIVDSSEDAIISKDLSGIITSWNKGAEELFGYTAQEVIGQSITILIPKERHGEEPIILDRIKRGERVDHFDTVRLRKDGRPIDISLTISPIRDRAGRTIGASKIARDITDRKLYEKALLEADRRKDEFLATLAHELRNPMAPIRNAVQILMSKSPAHPDLQWTSGVLDRQVRLMTRLLEDLLDVSRISRNTLELRRERVELRTIVDLALETSLPVFKAGGQELTIDYGTEPIFLDGDPVRLSQVFANLLNNAAKYSEQGGRTILKAERHGQDIIVTIKDEGIGIPADMLPRVFDIFSQAKPAVPRSQGGLGIGLSLVKGIVELHGGSVAVRSEGPGRGSEFVVRLPIGLHATPEPPARAEGGGAPEIPPSRILIVDDNRDSVDSLAMLLGLLGHEVATAYDGEQAVRLAAEFRPEIVMLDIGMPKLNGYEACRKIRQEPWGQQMTILALTGWSQEADRRRTQEAGFDHHMVKPVDLSVLMNLLSERSRKASPAS